MSKTATLSFRTEPSLAEETYAYAKFAGFTKTDYLEQAVKEKNERTLAARIQFLSKQLSASSLVANEDMDFRLEDAALNINFKFANGHRKKVSEIANRTKNRSFSIA